jgi:hypothetical protein
MAELEIFAHYKVHSIILCDSNFGMQATDEQFLEDVIKLRERTGYPRSIETSWTKNKSDTFYRIVKRMKAAGLHTSFTVALQTLDDAALRGMNRRNMKLNDWQALAQWLAAEGLDTYAEILWGAPGETTESFLRGYDELSLHVPRIATYPLMLLPNTEYSDKRQEFGLVTTRGQSDDFEYVLASNTMTLADNLAMQGFLLWARAGAENSFFRYIWRPLRTYAGLTQSQVLFSLARWFDACSDPAARALKSPTTILEPAAVNVAVHALLLDPQVRGLLGQWWAEEIRPLVRPEHLALLDEVFRFDMMTLPLIASQVDADELSEEDGALVHRRSEPFDLDVPALVAALRAEAPVPLPEPTPTMFELSWRLGLEDYVDSHEVSLQYMGRIERSDQLEAAPSAG